MLTDFQILVYEHFCFLKSKIMQFFTICFNFSILHVHSRTYLTNYKIISYYRYFYNRLVNTKTKPLYNLYYFYTGLQQAYVPI